MGIPVIESAEDFRQYVSGVEHRKDYKKPFAFGIGAIRLDDDGSTIQVYFPRVNKQENFGSAAAFADVTHHYSGSAIRTLDYWQFKELEAIFKPFLEEEGHSNVEAFKEVWGLVSKHGMSGVIVFVDEHDESCQDKFVYKVFLDQLSQEVK